MSKQYIGSQEHWEDSVNADYDQRERQEQEDNRIQEDQRTQPTPEMEEYSQQQLLEFKEKLNTFLQERIKRAFKAIDTGREDQEYPFDGRGPEELDGMRRAYSDIMTTLNKLP